MGFDPCVCTLEMTLVCLRPDPVMSSTVELVDSGPDEISHLLRCEVEDTKLCECPSGDFGKQTVSLRYRWRRHP